MSAWLPRSVTVGLAGFLAGTLGLTVLLLSFLEPGESGTIDEGVRVANVAFVVAVFAGALLGGLLTARTADARGAGSVRDVLLVAAAVPGVPMLLYVLTGPGTVGGVTLAAVVVAAVTGGVVGALAHLRTGG